MGKKSCGKVAAVLKAVKLPAWRSCRHSWHISLATRKSSLPEAELKESLGNVSKLTAQKEECLLNDSSTSFKGFHLPYLHIVARGHATPALLLNSRGAAWNAVVTPTPREEGERETRGGWSAVGRKEANALRGFAERWTNGNESKFATIPNGDLAVSQDPRPIPACTTPKVGVVLAQRRANEAENVQGVTQLLVAVLGLSCDAKGCFATAEGKATCEGCFDQGMEIYTVQGCSVPRNAMGPVCKVLEDSIVDEQGHCSILRHLEEDTGQGRQLGHHQITCSLEEPVNGKRTTSLRCLCVDNRSAGESLVAARDEASDVPVAKQRWLGDSGLQTPGGEVLSCKNFFPGRGLSFINGIKSDSVHANIANIDVFDLPLMKCNLSSVLSLLKDSCNVHSEDAMCSMCSMEGGLLMCVKCNGNEFFILVTGKIISGTAEVQSANISPHHNCAHLWQQGCAHVSEVQKVPGTGTDTQPEMGNLLTCSEVLGCTVCQQAKVTLCEGSRSANVSSQAPMLTQMDSCKPREALRMGGTQMFLSDGHTRMSFTIPLMSTGEELGLVSEWVQAVKPKFACKVFCFQADHGSVCAEGTLQGFFPQKGSKHRLSAPRGLQGCAVAGQDTILGKTLSAIVFVASFLRKFWPCNSTVGCESYLSLCSEEPKVSLRLFEWGVFVMQSEDGPRSRKVFFVGYKLCSTFWKFVRPGNVESRVILSNSIEFCEAQVWIPIHYSPDVLTGLAGSSVDGQAVSGCEPASTPSTGTVVQGRVRDSGSVEGPDPGTVATVIAGNASWMLSAAQNNAQRGGVPKQEPRNTLTPPVPSTGRQVNRDRLFPRQDSGANSTRSSSRYAFPEVIGTQAGFIVTWSDEDANAMLSRSERATKRISTDRYTATSLWTCMDQCEPESFEEVHQLPEEVTRKWYKAMQMGLDSMEARKVFFTVARPEGQRAVHSRVVFRFKTTATGESQYRARFVARDVSKLEELHSESFAPTAPEALGSLLSTAAQESFVFNISDACLNSPLEDMLYTLSPQGFEINKPDDVLKLHIPIYGLKQSTMSLDEVLEGIGFQEKFTNSCLYLAGSSQKQILVFCFVDSIRCIANTEAQVQWFAQELDRYFKLKELGPVRVYLGVRIDRSVDYSFLLRQEGKIEQLVAKFKKADSASIRTPLEICFVEDSQSGEHSGSQSPVVFQSTLRSLLSFSQWSKPVGMFAVKRLSQEDAQPSVHAQNGIKKVLRYLGDTKELCFRQPVMSTAQDTCWSGSNWAKLQGRKSATEIGVKYDDALMERYSKRQSFITLFSAETEYDALSGVCGAIQICQCLVQKVNGECCQPITVWEDNRLCLMLTETGYVITSAKRADIRFRNVYQGVHTGLAKLRSCPSQGSLAVGFTKSLGFRRRNGFCKGLCFA
ncbi:uncharacterized protein LOC132591441 [Zootoca vivipara]|uniref:uncharacterized protein LOC132591441 n=1 Tax=Zootoca vivipara TaxID=8524 RepID=UPI00293BD1AE|nr:uncharacterized protein LOC132591441 [Zootoca vivipara]